MIPAGLLKCTWVGLPMYFQGQGQIPRVDWQQVCDNYNIHSLQIVLN